MFFPAFGFIGNTSLEAKEDENSPIARLLTMHEMRGNFSRTFRFGMSGNEG
jgi:hypothetical protein